ncbi:8-amino-7-oxononanoate synthase [Corallococcus sp. AB049A]|uniref:8-amino-7-oxononanoate synthase n=1 Tax=Corallococcus interemptor TaxID=2316720 RepID=A0A3A8R0B3_9BACT|nr:MULTISPECIES: 8-amino-7-oxononanoate synthase [Corallococcus]RKH41237.1 8-amino-7-oxononanoate synthase [Corallococcus sp. AB050B]RKH70552.1 8-amino-7-oxononanoate synthase [Corallococcus interemptor]RKI52012.1 8-amino-7-oxononanoate synthase [Corallococcus sp. AB049A]
MRPATQWAREDLEALSAKGLRRVLEPLDSPQGAEVRVGDERLVNFSSNDYLGLAASPAVRAAAASALERYGVGTGASRLVVGDMVPHQLLEARLARFERAEAVRLFNSGYAANTGILPALVGPGDAVFSDALNHASLVDGCRLSRARVVVYPHADVAALTRALEQTPARRKLVVTDSVFSMDGDVAPLRELVAACEAHGAALMVDEAHATGVLGARGAGLCEALGVEDRVDLRMGTLSKALGGLGAYVATSRAVADLLVSRARPFVYSTALPAALCAAAECAVDLVEHDPAPRERLWGHIHRFTDGLRALGLPAEPRSAIFPVILGEPSRALDAARRLREAGLLVKAIRPPTVPDGTSRLRFCLSAAHTTGHIDLALEALRRVGVSRGP